MKSFYRSAVFFFFFSAAIILPNIFTQWLLGVIDS